jgi:hypothetical protein
MASIRKRRTATGELRYDVRYRVQGRLVEQTFKRRRDADNRVRQVEADELTGGLIDPALGRETLASYSATWLEARLVRGRPLAAMTRQGLPGPAPPQHPPHARFGPDREHHHRRHPILVRGRHRRLQRRPGREELPAAPSHPHHRRRGQPDLPQPLPTARCWHRANQRTPDGRHRARLRPRRCHRPPAARARPPGSLRRPSNRRAARSPTTRRRPAPRCGPRSDAGPRGRRAAGASCQGRSPKQANEPSWYRRHSTAPSGSTSTTSPTPGGRPVTWCR